MNAVGREPEARPILATSCWSYGRWLMGTGGQLVIEPGRVVYESRRRLVHVDPTIMLVRARVPLMLARVTLRLTGENGELCYLWPFLKLRAVRRALEEAGFTLHEHTTWFIPWLTP